MQGITYGRMAVTHPTKRSWMKERVRTAAVWLALGAGLSLPSSARTQPSPGPRSSALAQTSAEDPLAEAETLIQREQYTEAEAKLQPIMTARGKNPQAWFDLGFAQSHQGKTQEAVASYQKAVELAPNWFEANLNLGLDLERAGNISAAVTTLRHAVTLKPTSGGDRALARAWSSLAGGLAASDAKAAALAYDQAAELDPADLELAVRAGELLERSGDPAGAEQRYRRAAESGNPAAVSKLISLLSGEKRYDEAAGWLGRFLERNPQNAGARVQLGRLLLIQGKTDDAISALEVARASSADPEILRGLAVAYTDAKQYDKAAGALEELARKIPGDAQLRWDLGRAFMRQHKYAEAETAMLEALKLNPRLDNDAWELAYSAQQNKHWQLAINVLDWRAKRLQETAATYWIRAVSYDSLGAVKPAAANYKLFLQADAGKSPDQEFQARHRLKAFGH
jgi:tetratricopeptide (TPR) repeat protein